MIGGLGGSYCTSCMDGSGYRSGEGTRSSAVRSAANIRRAAAVAIAVSNAEQAIDNYRKQRDIARRSVTLSERQQQQLQDVYWPREIEFLEEFGDGEQIEAVEVLGRRYAGRLVAGVAAGFAQAMHDARCNASRYCTSASRKRLQDLLLARGTAMANARILGRNIGFAEFQARTDTDFNRRMQAVSMGRNLMGEASKLLASASGGLAAAASTTMQRLGSALEAFGYAGRRDYGTAQDARYQGEEMYRTEGYFPQQGAPFNTGPNPLGVQGMLEGFGQADMSTAVGFSSVQGGVEPNWYSAHDPQSTHQGMQLERWNAAKVGDNNLIRTGTVTFPVQGMTGGSVTIGMSAFGVQHADDRETTPANGGGWGMVVEPYSNEMGFSF